MQALAVCPLTKIHHRSPLHCSVTSGATHLIVRFRPGPVRRARCFKYTSPLHHDSAPLLATVGRDQELILRAHDNDVR